MVDGVQVGLVSYSLMTCADPSDAGVYTRISSYAEWITQLITVDNNDCSAENWDSLYTTPQL